MTRPVNDQGPSSVGFAASRSVPALKVIGIAA